VAEREREPETDRSREMLMKSTRAEESHRARMTAGQRARKSGAKERER